MSRSVITRLFLVACVASGPASGEGVAQTLSSHPLPGLGVAIEGVMGGQFHRSIEAPEKRDLLWNGLSSGRHSELHWSSPWLGSLTASADSVASKNQIFWTMVGLGVPVYLGTGAIVFTCYALEGHPASTPFCNLPVFTAVPILGMAGVAHTAGASFPRALIGSALGGAAAVGILYLTGVEPFSAGGLGLLVGVHASVTTLSSLIHFRKRQ